MIGQSKLSINKSTAVEAMQEWLAKRWILYPPTVTDVEETKGNYNWALVVTLEGSEKPESSDD